MKIRELLTGQQILTLKPDDRVGMAAQLMAWGNVRHLPVLRGEKLIGILSERDILRYRSAIGHETKADRVDEAMSAPVHTAHPDDDLVEAEARMLADKLGCLPVVEEGHLRGVITTTDLLATHVREHSLAEAGSGSWDAKQVMSKNPIDARSDDSLLGAILRMADRNVRHLPVVDNEHRVVGMLSDRDVRARIGNPERLMGRDMIETELITLRVRDAMTTSVTTIEEDLPLARIVDQFLDERVGALPVVDSGSHLVGIVSYLDVLKILRERGSEQPAGAGAVA